MTKRKAQRNDAMRMLNVRIERDKVEQFRVVAEADHRTVSQELRRLIEQRIAEADTEMDQAA